MRSAALRWPLALLLAACGTPQETLDEAPSAAVMAARPVNVLVHYVNGDHSPWAELELDAAIEIFRDQVGIELVHELQPGQITEPLLPITCRNFIANHSPPDGVVNIYFRSVGIRGANCGEESSFRNVVWVGTASRPTTVAHEVGHAFSLEHVDLPGHCTSSPGAPPEVPNLMCDADVRNGFDGCQKFWMLRNIESAWNWLPMHRITDPPALCCQQAFAVRSGTEVAPPRCHSPVSCCELGDGGIPADPEADPLDGLSGGELLELLERGPTDEERAEAERGLMEEAAKLRGRPGFPGTEKFVQHYLENWERGWRLDILQRILELPEDEVELVLGQAVESRTLDLDLIELVRANPEVE